MHILATFKRRGQNEALLSYEPEAHCLGD